jgi:hypothetical protein
VGPAPEPEGDGDVAGGDVVAQLPAELHRPILRGCRTVPRVYVD